VTWPWRRSRMFGGAFMRPEWGKDGSGQSPSERLFKLRLKATSAFTASYYPRALSGRFEAELRCTDTDFHVVSIFLFWRFCFNVVRDGGRETGRRGYVFTVRAKNRNGARDLSRRNAGPADPRWEIAMPCRQPTFLRTKVRAPIAVPGGTVNTYRRGSRPHRLLGDGSSTLRREFGVERR